MSGTDPMLEIFIFENGQLLETLETILLEGEKNKTLEQEQIDEIFRIMHTIKGSSAMMNYEKLSHVAHAIEDLFSQIREKPPRSRDWERIFDIVLGGADFIKAEMAKITVGQEPDGEAEELIGVIRTYLGELAKRKLPPPEEKEEEEPEEELEFDFPGYFYRAKLLFEADCKMENIRAFGVVNALTPAVHKIASVPEDLLAEDAGDLVADKGCLIFCKTDAPPDDLRTLIAETMFLKSFTFDRIDAKSEEIPASIRDVEKGPVATSATRPGMAPVAAPTTDAKQSFLSVNVVKLDKLMDLVGEIVTTESMVTKNPDIVDMQLDNFDKAAQMLRKLTDELQDIVLSIRMVPISTTFHKMQRLVRDMSKKVNKDVDLEIIGEETEIDKSINDNLGDPLMHMIRNSMDHGIERPDERVLAGKSARGTITLEARNTGGDIMIIISDDGKGLNREKILEKASARGILTKPESEMSDREVYNLIFSAGFSTKEQVTEFSGRGVGMDVVRRNIDNVGGTLSIESTPGQGMSTIIRIPLSLAIVDGMRVQVGDSTFILPVLSILQSFKPQQGDVFSDPDGNEMIMIRGRAYRILRLSTFFGIQTPVTSWEDGILIMIASDEGDDKAVCLFVDRLIGEQQAVVKPMPAYITRQAGGKLQGISGCTVLGDGSISLILDINGLVES